MREVIIMNEIMFLILSFALTIVEAVSMDYFWSKISYRRKRHIFFWIVAWAVMLADMIFGNQLVNMVSGHLFLMYIVDNLLLAMYIAYAVFFFNVSAKKAFVFMTICFITTTTIEFTLTYIMLAIGPPPMGLMSSVTVRCIGMTILEGLELLILHCLYRINKRYCNAIEHYAIICLLIISYFVDFVLTRKFYSSKYYIAIFTVQSVGIMVYQVAIIVFFGYYLVSYHKQEQEYKEIINFTESQLLVLNDIDEKIGDSRRILHDMTNHLSTIKILAEQDRTKDIGDYVIMLIPELKSTRVPDVSSSILSVILYEKRMKARRSNVELACMIGVEDIKIPMFELNAIVGNILDNAIEACEKVLNHKERIVDFRIDVKGENLTIECQNPYTVEPLLDKRGDFLTSKQDVSAHGNGIKLINEYVDRHKGDVDIHFHKGIFTIRVILSNEVAVIEGEDESAIRCTYCRR